MKKTYNVIIGSDSFQITAFNLAEARQTAQFNKGRLGLKGRTKVYTGKEKRKGAFNIYQSKAGAIIIVMGNGHTELTSRQIIDLGIDCYGLTDFDIDQFKQHYQ